MQQETKLPPIWLPPIQIDLLVAIILVILGSNIEKIPDEYHSVMTNPLIFIVGILVAAGLASAKYIAISFAIAFCLVNIIRLIPTKPANPIIQKVTPGKEGFVPSGTLDWVTTNKKWFVEKVMHETPIAIVEKEVATYPVD
jgi:hypothetical protein